MLPRSRLPRSMRAMVTRRDSMPRRACRMMRARMMSSRVTFRPPGFPLRVPLPVTFLFPGSVRNRFRSWRACRTGRAFDTAVKSGNLRVDRGNVSGFLPGYGGQVALQPAHVGRFLRAALLNLSGKVGVIRRLLVAWRAHGIGYT